MYFDEDSSPSYPRQNTPQEMCQFTGIPQTCLSVSFVLQDFPQFALSGKIRHSLECLAGTFSQHVSERLLDFFFFQVVKGYDKKTDSFAFY